MTARSQGEKKPNQTNNSKQFETDSALANLMVNKGPALI